MKSLFKYWWIISLAFVVSGFTLLVVAWSLGANGTTVYFDTSGLHVSRTSDQYSTTTEPNLDPFTSIDVSAISADIVLVASDHYGFEAQLPSGEDELHWDVSDGRLTISAEHSDSWRLSLFDFNFDFSRDYHIVIYYPLGTELQDVSTKTTSGETNISRLFANNLTARSISGKIDITASRVANVDLETTSGEISYMAEVAPTPADAIQTSLRAKSISGGVYISNTTYTNLSAETISGSIGLAGTAKGPAFLKSISGPLHINLIGTPTDFNFLLSSVSGGLRINNQDAHSYIEANPSGSTELKAETVSGPINIYITE